MWDNITVHGGNNDIQNAGNYGSGHGWEGANCVIWNNAANGFIVQNPPGANNWLIGSIGPIQTGTAWNIGYTNMPHAPGNYDSSGSTATNVFPDSIYFSQLQDRLAAPNLQTRDYWLGDIDAFSNNVPGGEKVFLDLSWSNAVKSAAGGQPLDGFDVVTNNHWIPFTFNFTLAPNEHVVAATFSLAMRASNSAGSDVLCLGSTSNSFTFSNLGWLPVGTGTNTTVRVLDLASQLTLLTNGQLNVAAQGDLGIDWAMLELQVAPNAAAATTSLTPVADATVRGGTNAANNFGTATNLIVQQSFSTNNQQQAYLRWDLSGVSGIISQARVILTPISVGANAIEQGVAVANSNNWTETGVTWNNQPGGGERFATWISSTNGPVSFDVTPQVLDALQNDRQLSLKIFSISTNSVTYASAENANAAIQPQLVLSQLGSPPAISSISNRSIVANASTGPISFTIGGSSNVTLAVSGTSSNPSLVPNANLVFGGSGTNRTVTVTPLADQTGIAIITVTVTDSSGLTASDNFTLTVSSHPAATIVWNGPGAGANNWSASGNWLPAETPGFLDDVKFFNAGAGGLAVSNINNFVDASFGGNIASLQYGNTNGNHTTLIGSGNSLNLLGTNGLVAGTETDNGSSQTVFATITGPGGTLNLNNSSADLIVRQGSANNSSQRATLDLSGLGNFNATLNQILVAAAGPVNRATGTLYLGQTNIITATGSPGIIVGDNGSNAGGPNYFYLGQVNSIFADSITIGRKKATSTLKFKPGLASPSAYFRASDGASRVSTWSIGDGATLNASSSLSIGTNDFTGGTVDALVDTLTVGRSQQTSGANGVGVLTFTAGTFDVNTLQIGFQTQAGVSAGIGLVNVNGTNAALNVNTVVELGFCGSGSSTNATTGTLFVNGGAANVNTIAVGAGSGTNAVVVNNGSLILANAAGSLAQPLGIFALTNATLEFSVVSGATNFVTTSLVTGGMTNTLNLNLLPAVGTLPAQLTLIKYSAAIGGAGYNFVVGSLVPGGGYSGYLSNNAANSSVDLVITNYIVPDPFLTWDGGLSGDWDQETANWKNNLGGGLFYIDGDAVMFNDSASGATNINLTDTFAPASITVSNNLKTITFQDGGSLTGAMALSKQGGGTLIFDNGGSNDFTGGVTIGGGVLQIGGGDANGNLPVTGNVTDNGALVFSRSDSVMLPNSISGSGTLAQIGGGVLILSGASSFTGAVTIASGTLQVNNASAFGGANQIAITNGGTLDVNGFNLGTNPVIVSGPGAGGNGAIINTGAAQINALKSVTLAGDAVFGGTGRWDIRGGASSLSTGGRPFNLFKTGANQISLVGISLDTNLAAIDIRGGMLGFEQGTTSMGNAVSNLTVEAGAILEFYQSAGVNNWTKQFVLNGDGVTPSLTNSVGGTTLNGAMTLNGSCVIAVSGAGLTNNCVTGGAGSLTKTGGAPLVVTTNETYTGGTLVNAGAVLLAGGGSLAASSPITVAAGAVLDASGRADDAVRLTNNQVLQGNGTVNGSLLIGGNAMVAPGGSAIGILTVTNVLTLQGTTFLKLSKSPVVTNDMIRGAQAISYGGTLSLTNLGGTINSGDSFKLFYANNYSNTFAKILPAIPRAGLAWDTSALNSGTLKVTTAVTPRPPIGVSLAGGNLVVAGGTSSLAGVTYYLLASTNLALPLANWLPVATNVFDGNGFGAVTNPVGIAAQNYFLIQVP